MQKIILFLAGVYLIFFSTCSSQKNLTKQDSSSQKTGMLGNAATEAAMAETHLFNGSFPIIFYAVSGKDWAFKRAKKWGATHVHRYGMGRSIKKDQSYFDLAAKYGLKVMANLSMRYWLNQKHAVDSLRLYVQHFKNHPALGFWYLSDEPAGHGFSVAELKPFYKMIKEVTPNIPIAISHAWITGWYKYGPVQDILLYNSYPITGGNFPKVNLGSWTAFAKTAINSGNKHKDASMPTLQMFSWKAMAQKSQETVRSTSVEKLRYPNTRELRYMTFTSIALGAQGLAFYSFARSRMVNVHWGNNVLAPVIQEVKTFMNHVGSAQIVHILSGQDKDLFLTLWIGDKSTFLILVNASSNARSVQQSLKGSLSGGTLEPWGHTRNVKAKLEGGSITVKRMKPWEVLIFKVS